ncbi:putative integral membrane protein [Janibacter sp. HTCC2649]|uniref:ABC transporter permease n=1 Tax=Janibacter sp. HTCC2649 TaxID=313589 RepID=UPI0000671911|nr:ABC transporter permease subunit [Janibacter sp. HTCC2649]EAP97957.1 putative integral membrane protein [Janibacter sp. HTCC2649]
MSGSVTSRPLSWRAELRRQLGRRRTLWVAAIVAVLPLLLVAAFSLDDDPGRPGDTTVRLVDLATSGGPNFTVFMLVVSAELLLFIVAALFAGDPVPAEASWASLRYLLTAPVSRARLLTSKLVVGFLSTAALVVVLPAWALLVGTLAYGSQPFSILGGGEMAWGQWLPRMLIAMGYVLVTIAPVGAFSFWVGVRSQTPLAAVGGALMLLIVSGILDSIDALGDWRKALPAHYSRAWLDLLVDGPINWVDLRHGALWSIFYTVLFVALGYRRFRRQDILS